MNEQELAKRFEAHLTAALTHDEHALREFAVFCYTNGEAIAKQLHAATKRNKILSKRQRFREQER